MSRRSVIELAGIESRRLVMHPLMLAGLALCVVAIAAGAQRDGQSQAVMLMGVAVLPLALAVFAIANLAALRSRRAGAEELLDTLPEGVRTRTGAQLLAVFVALPLAVGVLAGAYLLFGAGEGLVIGANGTRRVPALVELAQGPLLVLALGAVGVLLGRVAPVTLLAAVVIVVVVFIEIPLAMWAPDTAWRWAVPLVNDIIAVPGTWGPCEPRSPHDCGTVERFDTAAMAWHLVALAGIAVAAALAALAQRRSVRVAYACAAILVLAATTLAAA